MTRVLLTVSKLEKHYPTRYGVVRAVENVSFDIGEGETVALVGESGSGKTTVALALLRLIRPDSGVVIFEGTDIASLRGRQEVRMRQRLSIVFQNPYSSLDPRLCVRDIVGEPLKTAFGLRGADLEERVLQHLQDVSLGSEHLRRYPHEFSGGQRQRIAIARALALEPKLLILDEPTAALDVSVQAQVINLLRDLQERHQFSYLFISHSLPIVESVADRVLVMYLGRIVESGWLPAVFESPHHPYTQALLDSTPSIELRHRGRLLPLMGDVPSPLRPPPGCAFSPRCPNAAAKCSVTTPKVRQLDTGRNVACHYPLHASSFHNETH